MIPKKSRLGYTAGRNSSIAGREGFKGFDADREGSDADRNGRSDGCDGSTDDQNGAASGRDDSSEARNGRIDDRNDSAERRSGAWNYSLRLISIRGRSEREISKRLGEKGYLQTEVEETVVRLKAAGFIDDARLAEALIRTCTERRPMGAAGCRRLLKDRGIPEEIFKALKFTHEEELENAMKLVEKKSKLPEKYPPLVRKNRLFGFLQRRGFSSDVISAAMKKMEN
jgi:SOS response regulatory protein OraA/RecX